MQHVILFFEKIGTICRQPFCVEVTEYLPCSSLHLTECLHGTTRERKVLALLEVYRVPFTFPYPATIILCVGKGRMEVLFMSMGATNNEYSKI